MVPCVPAVESTGSVIYWPDAVKGQ